MRLSKILKQVGLNCKLNTDDVISFVSSDSRRIKKGSAFVCIKGEKHDGHDFIGEAYERGARTFFVAREISGYTDCNVIFVENPRKILAEISFLLAGNPERSLKIIAVTGTKGKSTVSSAIYKILNSLGTGAALVGTCGFFGVSNKDTKNTTPSSEILAQSMREAVMVGISYFILEASSQALADYRIYSLPLAAAVFTNLGQDHVGNGEHKNAEEYRNAKRRLFTDFALPLAVCNSDDESSKFMSLGVPEVIMVGRENADVILSDVHSTREGISFSLGGNFCNANICGAYNAENLSLAAVTVSRLLKIPLSDILPRLSDFTIEGRFELISRLGRAFVVDYAHNAMSAIAVLSECRKLTSGRLIVVFGSVGERSKARRCELAAAVSEFADFAVITSDNPGYEPPADICAEIASYYPTDSSRIVIDRADAIRYAFSLSARGDLIALLGKGQEKYQLVGNKKIYFSEREVIDSLRE